MKTVLEKKVLILVANEAIRNLNIIKEVCGNVKYVDDCILKLKQDIVFLEKDIIEMYKVN